MKRRSVVKSLIFAGFVVALTGLAACVQNGHPVVPDGDRAMTGATKVGEGAAGVERTPVAGEPVAVKPVAVESVESDKGAAAVAAVAENKPEVTATRKVRILTYNVRHSLGLDGRVDYERIAGIIKGLDPDVVCLQEIDVKTKRSDRRDGLAELARLTGMHGYFARAIDFQGGQYGVGALSKAAAASVDSQPLPGKEEARTMQVLTFDGFVVINTHLSLTAEDRVTSAGRVNERLEALTRVDGESAANALPVFFCGDLNEPDASAGMFQTLGGAWRIISSRAFTFRTDKPERTLDYVLGNLGGAYTVAGTAVVTEKDEPAVRMASDHLPLWVDVNLVSTDFD
ncbi:MAG TPA: endonuclease/exonuclease/phosphatase family protein [Myxococcota bacterium]|nr:endonuclease/exonuclease/phosphatase family protein [Myxococcota bacterium]